MGHANLTNISRFFVRRLYAKGTLSIRDCRDALVAAGETLHASEGAIPDPQMLGWAVEQVVQHLAEWDGCPCCEKHGPVIEPAELSGSQQKILREWYHDGSGDDWDWDEDNPDAEGVILDGIRWRFAKGWRTKYTRDEIPLLGNVTN